jgi:DNA polymerase III epsilon subunit-like protein
MTTLMVARRRGKYGQAAGLYGQRPLDFEARGHRILELAAVAVMDGKLTGRHVHTYLNPEHPVECQEHNTCMVSAVHFSLNSRNLQR